MWWEISDNGSEPRHWESTPLGFHNLTGSCQHNTVMLKVVFLLNYNIRILNGLDPYISVLKQFCCCNPQ